MKAINLDENTINAIVSGIIAGLKNPEVNIKSDQDNSKEIIIGMKKINSESNIMTLAQMPLLSI